MRTSRMGRFGRRDLLRASVAGSLVLRGASVKQAVGADPVSIGGHKQLFLDDAFIESAQNVSLRMNRPRKTGERSIVSEHPWEEHRVGAYNTVMEDEGIYKMWYFTMSRDATFLCYATSEDGLVWRKPNLALVDYRGSRQNNIVMLPRRPQPSPIFGEYQTSSTMVFVDPEASRQERYKCIIQYREDERVQPLGEPRLLVSADGLRWRYLADHAVIEDRRFTDTQMIAFWDRRIRKYVAYGRNWDPEWPKGVRKVSRSETSDLTRWPKPTLVFGRDEHDPDNCHFYNPAAMQYPYAANAYLMFPSVYYPHAGDGPLDIQLATSRDGTRWQRPERHPFLELGTSGSWDSRSMYVGAGLVRNSDEIWLYYTGFDFNHGSYDQKVDRKKGVISRAVLRLDGFVSADAEYTGGSLTTIPLTFEGRRLELNVNSGAGGECQVEVLAGDNSPFRGFRRQDCDVIRSNAVAHTVTWIGSSDVSALQGKTVRLRFHMRDARLYAFQFRG